MDHIVALVAVVSPFLFVFGLVWMILHYRDQRRKHKGASVVASAGLEALAERMERRIDALEQILDAEAPGWRKRHHEH